jgi:hypothetical protein
MKSTRIASVEYLTVIEHGALRAITYPALRENKPAREDVPAPVSKCGGSDTRSRGRAAEQGRRRMADCRRFHWRRLERRDERVETRR